MFEWAVQLPVDMAHVMLGIIGYIVKNHARIME